MASCRAATSTSRTAWSSACTRSPRMWGRSSPGFEAYVRIFHPASRREGDGEVEVRWAEIAAWSGRVVHAVMQFEPIATPVPGRDPGPRPWDGTTPRDGTLPLSHTASLAGQLGEFTTTPETCWF